MLRRELGELRDVLAQVREGALSAGAARSALNEMALRQNDWTLGAFCARYCGVVAQHHGLEDDAIFPHLARSDTTLAARDRRGSPTSTWSSTMPSRPSTARSSST